MEHFGLEYDNNQTQNFAGFTVGMEELLWVTVVA